MTATITLLEVRCTRCWRSNCYPVENVGSTQECQHCESAIVVPEATPERIARAEAILNEQPDLLIQPAKIGDKPSNRDKEDLLEPQGRLPLEQMEFSGHPNASLVARFFAVVVDNILVAVATVVGILAVIKLENSSLDKLLENPSLTSMIILYSFPIMLFAIQWIMLAQSGQTIGKKILFVRIVTMEGKLPGFLRAVVMRNWMRNLLYMLPFAGLIDCLFVLGESRRAGHDWIAGTRVIAVI